MIFQSNNISKFLGKTDVKVNKTSGEMMAVPKVSEIKNKEKGKERKLAVKSIECLTELDCVGGKKGILSGKSYTFKILEYQKDTPTEEEKKNIKWDFSYSTEEGVVVGTEPKKIGDTFTLNTEEFVVKDAKFITICAYFEDRNQEAFLELNVLNEYCVIVGFEVNNLNAYEKETYQTSQEIVVGTEIMTPSHFVTKEKEKFHLDRDTGHAFYYLSRQGKVEQFLSFGPTGTTQTDRLYDDGTPDYHIPEEVQLFKIPLTFAEYELLMKETKHIREEIISGKAFSDISYNVFINDTCASVAKEVLDKVIPHKIPKGKSVTAVLNTGLVSVINPYAWYDGFKNSLWAESEKIIPANENFWQQIMTNSQTKNKSNDPYNQ